MGPQSQQAAKRTSLTQGGRSGGSFGLQGGRVSCPPPAPAAPSSCPLSLNIIPPSSLLGIPQSYCFNELLAL